MTPRLSFLATHPKDLLWGSRLDGVWGALLAWADSVPWPPPALAGAQQSYEPRAQGDTGMSFPTHHPAVVSAGGAGGLLSSREEGEWGSAQLQGGGRAGSQR